MSLNSYFEPRFRVFSWWSGSQPIDEFVDSCAVLCSSLVATPICFPGFTAVCCALRTLLSPAVWISLAWPKTCPMQGFHVSLRQQCLRSLSHVWSCFPLTSHKPILSFARNAKFTVLACSVWDKLHTLLLCSEIQSCTFSSRDLYCCLAFRARRNVFSVQFRRFLFAARLCRKVFVPTSMQTYSCFAYVSNISRIAVWDEKEYNMFAAWKKGARAILW